MVVDERQNQTKSETRNVAEVSKEDLKKGMNAEYSNSNFEYRLYSNYYWNYYNNSTYF